MNKKQLLNVINDIRLLIFDVDGVLTDGTIYMSEDGHEPLKGFNIHDGLGMVRLFKSGVEIAIITGRTSQSVTHRMDRLGIKHVYQGQQDKLIVYEDLCQKLGLKDNEVAYLGDDLPDLPVMQRCGLGIAVANAVPPVIKAADWVTEANGGRGAAREVCELIISSQQPC